MSPNFDFNSEQNSTNMTESLITLWWLEAIGKYVMDDKMKKVLSFANHFLERGYKTTDHTRHTCHCLNKYMHYCTKCLVE